MGNVIVVRKGPVAQDISSGLKKQLRGPVQLGSVAADMSDIHRLSLYHALIHDPSCPHTCDGLLHHVKRHEPPTT